MSKQTDDLEVKIFKLEKKLETLTGDERSECEMEISVMQKRLERLVQEEEAKEAEKAEKQRQREEKDRQREEKQRPREEAAAQAELIANQRYGELEDLVGENVASVLDLYKNGMPVCNANNIRLLLDYHFDMPHHLRKNLFTLNYELDGEEFSDEMMNSLAWDVQEILGDYNENLVSKRLSCVASKNAYHPILEKVDAMEWDGERRLVNFFIKTIGAKNEKVIQEISFRWLCAMYRRVKQEGCPFDAYLAVSDPTQGTGKSTIFEKLTTGLEIGNNKKKSFTTVNAKPNLGDKDMALLINASAIVQFDESADTKYTKLEPFKSFITTKHYRLRLPYDKYPKDFDVHCVYAVTTNDTNFLTDTTSDYERRAWVMPCNGVVRTTEKEWAEVITNNDIQQIWAEAKWWNEHPDEAYNEYGWNIKGSGISFLSNEGKVAMKALQQQAKTMTDDTAAINALDTIFNQAYTEEEFTTPKAFIEDTAANKWGTNIENFSVNLTKIPCAWVCDYVSKLVRGSRSQRYIDSLIQSDCVKEIIGTWVKKPRVWYAKKQLTCYVKLEESTEKQPQEAEAVQPAPTATEPKKRKTVREFINGKWVDVVVPNITISDLRGSGGVGSDILKEFKKFGL